MIAQAAPVDTAAELSLVIEGEAYHVKVLALGLSYRVRKLGTRREHAVRDYGGVTGWRCDCTWGKKGGKPCRHLRSLREAGLTGADLPPESAEA